MSGADEGTPLSEPRRPRDRRHVLYPNHYVWFVFLSAMDVMMTWVVLAFGGREVNGVADAVISRYGLPGMVAYKFVLVVLVVGIAEAVGPRNPRAGRFVARAGVVVTCVPLVAAFAQLLRHVWG